jgi:DNA-3-methyladenine glycosylase
LSEWDEIDTPIARPRVLDRAEIPVDTALLAHFLIGKMLVRVLAEGVAGGRIVETEAYGIGDPAGHAYRGITLRNRALFLERGHAYVYLAYGSSFMLNVSSVVSHA